MSTKYKYNTQTLSYEKVERTKKDRLVVSLFYLVFAIAFSAVTLLISYSYFESPKLKQMKRENENLSLAFEMLNKRVKDLDNVLTDIQYRDDNIYRVIFEAEPIPANIRKSGRGGVSRYNDLEGFDNSKLVIETTKKLDNLEKHLYVQSKSYDEVYEMAKKKENMLAAIPAIQPVANKDLRRMASGYGMRVHPVYKTKKFHKGMDFSATIGTEIYSTGDGVVRKLEQSRRGYGNHVVIDHGYGYETLYAHMVRFNVRQGQKVKRGDVIGFVGSTGLSTSPHLHYEVHKKGQALNPVNFYFNDLTPEEYDKMIEISSASNQSFD